MNSLNMPADMEVIKREFQNEYLDHRNVSVAFEHGQYWVTCHDCGAEWSVSETDFGECCFNFEQISPGDESCEDVA